MNWLELVAGRIWNTLRGAGMPEAKAARVLAEEMEQVIEATEHGRPFGAPQEETKPAEEEPLVRGEKLSDLRARTIQWGGWESWKQ